jgi:hypothetical protein
MVQANEIILTSRHKHTRLATGLNPPIGRVSTPPDEVEFPYQKVNKRLKNTPPQDNFHHQKPACRRG